MRDKIVFVAYALMAGCTMFENPSHCTDRGDGICWWTTPVQIPVTSVRWEVDTSLNASKRCGFDFHYERATCVMSRDSGICWIVSAYTENAAKRIPVYARNMYTLNGKSIYTHEVQDHCGINPDGTLGVQWSHSNTHVRTL